MFKNNFRIALRNLLKQKQFAALNLLGLSTGLACILLIYLWVNDELKVDKFNVNDNRLYQVFKNNTNVDGSIETNEITQGLLADEMKNAIPEIEFAVQVHKDGHPSVLSYNEKRIKIKHQFAGKDFFRVFSYPLVSGNYKNVSGVKGIYLSDNLALKLFNSMNVVGKIVFWNYEAGDIDLSGPFNVAGVFKAPPANATMQFDMLIPFDFYARKFAGTMGDVTFWGSNMVSTYIVLRPGVDIAALNNRIKDFTIQKIKSAYPGADLVKYEGKLVAQRYSDGYLNNNYVNGKRAGGRIEYVRLLSVIAIFILLIACINFINLSTVKAAGRMREVGVRKVIGASRTSLVFQYMAESIMLSYFAMTLAITIAYLLLPAFSQITGKELLLTISANLILFAFGFPIFTGIIAGLYPAIYLSNFKPVSALKGKLVASAGASFIRKGLVVFQFTISAVLIIAVLIVYQQMKLVQTKNLGYDRENIIRFSVEGRLLDQEETFLNDVKNIPGVKNATTMNGDLLGKVGHGGGGIDWDG
ncbi:MAG: hypothetical protein C5B59_03570 [Bacteroidetes bacterium]|nr:MAG: hypothetical protein C5B59_03570 [Bacteroidota bacterium]